jgi:hypothetical protein
MREQDTRPADVTVAVPAPPTPTARRVLDIAIDNLTNFFFRQTEYGEPSEHPDDDLGLAGQFSDINRKVKKLRRYMWDSMPVPEGAEGVEEICGDLIGHLWMTIDLIRQSKS